MANPAPYEVINEIRDRLKDVEAQSHYERLGVQQGTDTVHIKRAYMKLAAKWHPDRFSQFELGPAEPQLQRLFSLITEAHTILTNTQKKESYDAALEWETKPGESTSPDILAMMGADNTFRLGQQLLERGQLKAAHAKFQEAAKLNDESHEYKSFLAYTEFAVLKKRPNGKPINEEAAEKHVETIKTAVSALTEFDMGHVFLGKMHLAMDKRDRAIRSFKNAIVIKPKNVEANRQLRLLAMRSNSGGFFSKITSLFKKD